MRATLPGRGFVGACALALLAAAWSGDAGAFALGVSYETYEVTNFEPFSRVTTHADSSTSVDPTATAELGQTFLIERLGSTLAGSVDGHAGVGSFGVGANGTVTPTDYSAFDRFDIDVRAWLNDSVIFDSIDPDATRIRVQATLPLHGGFANSRVFPGSAVSGIKIYGTGIAPGPYSGNFYGYSSRGDFGSNIELPAPEVIAVSFEAIVGVPTPLSITFELFGSASAANDSRGAGSGTFIGDFTRTLTWGGITSVTDALTGAPLTDWSVTSESGFNYANAYGEPAQSVPEPPPATLLCLALALLYGSGPLLRLRTGKPQPARTGP